jgi:hypothetical protein
MRRNLSIILVALTLTLAVGLITSPAVTQSAATYVQSWGIESYLHLTSTARIWATGNRVAGIDSFATTAASDTLAITGVGVGDVFVITEYCPTWDATPDTVTYAYQATTNQLVVFRRGPETTGLKSAGKYAYVRIDK